MVSSLNISPEDVIKVLTQRGRWLHAGNDNLPGYLAHLLGYRTHEAKTCVRQLLRTRPEGIVVEFDPRHPSRVVRIGLPAWMNSDVVVETEEIPSGDDLLEAYLSTVDTVAKLTESIAALQVTLAELEAHHLKTQGDLVAAEELLRQEGESSCDHPSEIDCLNLALADATTQLASLKSALETVRRESGKHIKSLRADLRQCRLASAADTEAMRRIGDFMHTNVSRVERPDGAIDYLTSNPNMLRQLFLVVLEELGLI